jgi:serine/threonine protein kinase/Flp pilus assembly protein TadD
MNAEFRRVKEIFLAAVEKGDPAARGAYLHDACGQDTDLRRQVDALLGKHAQAGSFLEGPGRCPEVTVDDPPLAERPDAIIGPYKLLEQIGEGGFGVVFMAEQQQPIRRKVALKVLKPGMDTRQVIARFEAERQALALMDHPNIAKVHDGGATPTGRPYVVMELVKGVPITDFCDQNHLTPRQRLELFLSVCQAVQHAHQKGIIHRDLKPSNVLVTVHDTTPMVKVIDFGIAKALGQQLTDKTLFTGFAQMIGTPLYMSPEQAGQSGLDVDTRSDIYSLGVLLYELLTGTTPFDKDRLKELSYDELRRIIREEEPPKPSTRISTLGQAATTVSTNRKSDPKQLSRLFRGELDWIVMKALEKDRNRRYESASAFAADVQRYLADEPVLACPPSAWYGVRKFARRNRTALTVAGLVLFFIAVVGATLGWTVRDRAAVAEQAARDKAARQEKLEGRISQALEETKAEYERDNLPEALARIQRIDALLAGDTDVSDELRQRVEQWRAELAILQRLEDIALLPYERSLFLQTDAAYARVFRDIGIDIDALPAEEAGRRIRTHVTWKRLTEALDGWALLRHDLAFNKPPPPDAWPRKLRLLQVARAADPDELRSQARLAAEKWDLAAAERLAGLPEVGRLPAGALRHLAMVIYYGNTGGNTPAARDRAVGLLLNALVLRPGDFRLNTTCANWYGKMDPPRWAESAHYGSIAVALRPEIPDLRLGLASALRKQGRLDEAIAQCREALRLNKNYPEAHNELGVALRNQGKRDDAIAEWRKAIALDPNLAVAHCNLGGALREQGKVEEAIAECRKAIELDPNYGPAHSNLAGGLAVKGRLDEAVAECREAIRIKEDDAGPHYNLGQILVQQGQFRQALEELRRGHELGSKDPRWPYPSAQFVRQCERLVELDGKLPAFLEGKATPASAAERIELARLCLVKHLDGAAARFYEEAFTAEPKLAENLQAFHRYNAACAAALAACGQGKDADQLDEKEKARLRGRALAWLRADLEALSRLPDKGADAARLAAGVGTVLRHWQADPDLAGVRGAEALGKLPEAERQAWKKLWDDAADVLARAQAKTTPGKQSDAK